MSLKYDLHSHSTISDGTLTPGELVALAARSGVDVLGLTDHDNVSGIAEARVVAGQKGIALVPGTEISVSWNGYTVHILGLNVDPEAPELLAGLHQLCRYRTWRAEEIGRRLEKKGISGAYAGACELATGALVGRLHFARFLVQQGHAPDTRAVFRKYLVKGKPGYVNGEWASLEDALSWIERAGGLAVIAHPARYSMTRGKLRQLIGEFKALGGRGLEVVSGSHSRDEYFTMAKHARDFGLLASAGSDYHGPENPWINLGQLPALPPGCEPVWNHF
ncbi:PHP domain-containing protein [Thiolapillus brandeum]|uniref:PHP family metal-dependent phosphoesterase n=1 Tax=Thiolapillus brandeum TaxID=1076588 RepID=A0A7U6GHV2_9GAMM|nr:PHP domain-containing protein [Thiolapillus brandeum]BAO43923.1 PHP family metal-dependent phosphoesterase [Thiolapillus brandeum]